MHSDESRTLSATHRGEANPGEGRRAASESPLASRRERVRWTATGARRGEIDEEPAMEHRRLLESTLGQPFSEGNRIRALTNGVEIFPAMLRAIEEARESIDFLTFVYWTGEIADQFATALARRAEEGLQVRVMLDAFGAREMSDSLVTQMENANVSVEWIRPLTTWKVWTLDHRCHRKILVCDEQVAFTGGVGIAKEWTGDARNPSEWRDTHFEIEGPAVAGLYAGFLESWIEAREGESHLDAYVPPDRLQPVGEAAIQIVRSSGRTGWSDAATVLHQLIASANSRIRIATAYFVPHPAITARLVEAAERGVDIHILIPGPHTDTRVSKLAGQLCYSELLEANIRISRYMPTMMHAKLITIDGQLACVGSANLNQRSLTRDDEIVVSAADTTLTRALDEQFDSDLKRAEPVTLVDLERSSWLEKAQRALVHPFRRQL